MIVLFCDVVGSSILLSIDRVWLAVRGGMGRGLWSTRLRDSLASTADHLRLLHGIETGLDVSTSHCPMYARPTVPVDGADVAIHLR